MVGSWWDGAEGRWSWMLFWSWVSSLASVGAVKLVAPPSSPPCVDATGWRFLPHGNSGDAGAMIIAKRSRRPSLCGDANQTSRAHTWLLRTKIGTKQQRSATSCCVSVAMETRKLSIKISRSNCTVLYVMWRCFCDHPKSLGGQNTTWHQTLMFWAWATSYQSCPLLGWVR